MTRDLMLMKYRCNSFHISHKRCAYVSRFSAIYVISRILSVSYRQVYEFNEVFVCTYLDTQVESCSPIDRHASMTGFDMLSWSR